MATIVFHTYIKLYIYKQWTAVTDAAETISTVTGSRLDLRSDSFDCGIGRRAGHPLSGMQKRVRNVNMYNFYDST